MGLSNGRPGSLQPHLVLSGRTSARCHCGGIFDLRVRTAIRWERFRVATEGRLLIVLIKAGRNGTVLEHMFPNQHPFLAWSQTSFCPTMLHPVSGVSCLTPFPEEFFMPGCSATFDENSVPPWTRGTSGGFLNAGTNPPRRSATAVAAVKASQAFTPSDGGDFQGGNSARNQGCSELESGLT